MPPKSKFTKEEIIANAIIIVEREGIDALTARALGNELGSSARPIFTLFDSMDDVLDAVHNCANDIYGKYVEEGLSEELAFRGVGKAYIKFACDHPRLFQMLFMKEKQLPPNMNEVLQGIESHYEAIISSIKDSYGLDRNQAIDLYFHLWVYSHGIAVLIATNVCQFSQEQITQLISQVFKSLLAKIKTEGRL